MKRLLICSLSVALLHSAYSQSTFQSTFQTGISLPSKSKAITGKEYDALLMGSLRCLTDTRKSILVIIR